MKSLKKHISSKRCSNIIWIFFFSLTNQDYTAGAPEKQIKGISLHNIEKA